MNPSYLCFIWSGILQLLRLRTRYLLNFPCLSDLPPNLLHFSHITRSILNGIVVIFSIHNLRVSYQYIQQTTKLIMVFLYSSYNSDLYFIGDSFDRISTNICRDGLWRMHNCLFESHLELCSYLTGVTFRALRVFDWSHFGSFAGI